MYNYDIGARVAPAARAGACIAMALVSVHAGRRPVAAQIIAMQSVVSQPGASLVPVIATVRTTGTTVSATQNTFTFDSVNTPVARRSNGAPNCVVNAEIHKTSTSFAFLPSGCRGAACTQVSAHVFSSSNATAIPDGATLYTCYVHIAANAAAGAYPLVNISAAATDPSGQPLGGAVGQDGEIDAEPTLSVTAAPGIRGGHSGFGVVLSQSGGSVVGVQNIIAFDSADTPIAVNPDGTPRCTVNPNIGKHDTIFTFLPRGCTGPACNQVAALMLSTGAPTGIPDGATLYSCDVDIAADAMPGSHALSIVAAVAAVAGVSPAGHQFLPETANGAMTVLLPPTPTPTIGIHCAPQTAQGQIDPQPLAVRDIALMCLLPVGVWGWRQLRRSTFS